MENLFKKLKLKCHFMGLLVFMLFGLYTTMYTYKVFGTGWFNVTVKDLNFAFAYYVSLALLAFIWLMLIIKPNIKLHFLKDLFILATIINVISFIWYFPFEAILDPEGYTIEEGIFINLIAVLWNVVIYYYVIVKKVVTFDEYGKKE